MGWDAMQGVVLGRLGYSQPEADTITFWFLLVTISVTLMLLLLKMLVVD